MRTTSKKLRITSLVSVFGVPLLIASACSTDPGQGPISTGGVPSTGGTVGTGGTTNTTGGIANTGGTSTGGTGPSTGGTGPSTGGTSTGGNGPNTGGTSTGGNGPNTGGTSTGGNGPNTGGTSTGGNGPNTGGTSTGGNGPNTGGTSTGGNGPNTGGTSTGGTSTGGTSTGGTGGAGDLITLVAKNLDGKMLTGPCVSATGEKNVCLTNKAGTSCPGGNATNPLAGVLTTDTTITLGGDAAKTYTITLHIQGEVEAKEYTGGTDQKTAEAVSTKMDGFHIGGTPTGSNNYNVYMIRASSPATDYFLNDLIGNGVSDHTTYLIDYTAKITAKGGSTLRLIAADSNCSMIKNCGTAGGTQCSNPLIPDAIDPKAKSLNPSFDFTKPYDGQWVVMVVTSVTEG